jgi:hypothetical protein
MKAKSLFYCVIAFAVLLSGCHKGTGDQYVGQWTKVSGQGPDMTIAKHDDVFVIKESVPTITGDLPSYAGEMDGDALLAHTGYSDERFVIDKTNGHLLRPGEELAHASK